MSDTADRRLRELCALHGLDDEARDRLARLLEVVAGDPTAATTVTEPARAADVHLADSLVALELEEVRRAARIGDLGAGAGFPGLPLAIARPDAHVTLVESVGRKVAFLDRAVASIGLANAEPVATRAENWTAGLGACDLVTARAVAPLTTLVEYAAPLLAPGGALVAWKGARDSAEEADGAAAAHATGLEARGTRRVRPWPAVDERHLYLYVKVGPTPERYPRRAGMARKRPLRAST